MDRPTSEHLAQIRARLAHARRSQIDVLRRLAETEEQVAATFERLAKDDSHAGRRTTLAQQARDQAVRLRDYAGQLDRDNQ